MQVTTIQGIVKNGQIELSEDVTLPEMTQVYVVIPPPNNVKKVASPRLANQADAQRFAKTIEEDIDADL